MSKITPGLGFDDLSAEDKEIKMKDWELLRNRGGKTGSIHYNVTSARQSRRDDDTGFAPGRKPKTNLDLMASRTLLGL